MSGRSLISALFKLAVTLDFPCFRAEQHGPYASELRVHHISTSAKPSKYQGLKLNLATVGRSSDWSDHAAFHFQSLSQSFIMEMYCFYTGGPDHGSGGEFTS